MYYIITQHRSIADGEYWTVHTEDGAFAESFVYLSHVRLFCDMLRVRSYRPRYFGVVDNKCESNRDELT